MSKYAREAASGRYYVCFVFYLNYEMIYGGKNGDYNTIFIN